MNKKVLPSIGVSALVLIGALFVIWIGYLVIMRVFYPVHGSLLQKSQIEGFSGCGKFSVLLTASDEQFTEEWKLSSKSFDFTAQDVDKEIARCRKRIENNNGKFLWSYDEHGNAVYVDAETMEKIRVYQEKFLKRDFSVLEEQK